MAGTPFSAQGDVKSEVEPVVVPKGRDYAAASMRRWEAGSGKLGK
jgi:hypothetical protein